MPDTFTRNRGAEDGYLNMSVTAVIVLVMDGVEWDCVSYQFWGIECLVISYLNQRLPRRLSHLLHQLINIGHNLLQDHSLGRCRGWAAGKCLNPERTAR